MSEFINPKSMLTPGIAGAVMMFLANALCAAFPEVAFRYVALGLSFVLGLVVFQAAKIQFTEKATYWLLNSLIIFSTGIGASNIAANIEQPRVDASRAGVTATMGALVEWFIPVANAQPGPPAPSESAGSRAAADARTPASSDRRRGEAERARSENDARRAQAERLRSTQQDADARRKEQFFRPKGFFQRW